MLPSMFRILNHCKCVVVPRRCLSACADREIETPESSNAARYGTDSCVTGPSNCWTRNVQAKLHFKSSIHHIGGARGTIDWRSRAARRPVDLGVALLRKSWAAAASCSRFEAADLRRQGARPNPHNIVGLGRRLYCEGNQDLSQR